MTNTTRTVPHLEPKIISRDQHHVSRKSINPAALKVLYRLRSAGFGAYLVGGGVRDLLVGFIPKDFDVATDALPEQVREIFHNCRLIGKRFRLAHVFFGEYIVEVATFRGYTTDSEDHLRSETGQILRDNVYGSIEEDAYRRDFTVNALYYNIDDFTIVDFLGGLDDLNNKLVRCIGDPYVRYHEDPVRMLRAIRLSAKLNFTIESETAAPIYKHGHLLQLVPAARLFDEVTKLFLTGYAAKTFEVLSQFGLFKYLFAQTDECLQKLPFAPSFLLQALQNSDLRVAAGKSVTPTFLLATFLWYPFQERLGHKQKKLVVLPRSLQTRQAMREILLAQSRHVAMPRRLMLAIEEIWLLQSRLISRHSKRLARIFQHPRFRAAYDLLELRAQAGEPVKKAVAWWQEFQKNSHEGKQEMLNALGMQETHSELAEFVDHED